jgi:DNA-3-methyladenine glycosylase
MPNAAPKARRSSSGAPLTADFYDRDAAIVARDLLGAILEHRSPEGIASGRIVEVEAYLGPHDPACHAATGPSARNRHLHGPPGRAYVYFIYGMHHCMNAVTREEGYGSGVLIRAVEPVQGIALMRARRGPVPDRQLTSGPGKVCQALGIDLTFGGTPLHRGALRILRGATVPDEQVVITQRVGIRKAADWPLRFLLRDSPWVSKG